MLRFVFTNNTNGKCPFLNCVNVNQFRSLSTKRFTKRGKPYTQLALFSKKCPYMRSMSNSDTYNVNSVQLDPLINATLFSIDSNAKLIEKPVLFNYENCFKAHIDKKLKDGSYRYFNNINRLANKYPQATNQEKEVTVWCSNDYLGQSQNPLVLKAMKDAIDLLGTGAGGTRNIAGNNNLHLKLERELATLHRKQAALIFSSCFVANDATLSTLANKLGNCLIFSDELNHASMIQGIRNSKAEKVIFRHNDVDHLENLLRKTCVTRPKIIAFESVYSMNGTIGNIKDICFLAKKYNAITFLDEVHAVGLYGESGAGVAEHLDFYSQKKSLMEQVDIVSGTLGKAYGVVGGYIAGSNNLVDMIRSYAPGFIFTTSLPPPVVSAALTSVNYLKYSGFERQMQQLNTKYIKTKFAEEGLPILKNSSHILPLMVGDAKLCKEASDMLLRDHGIYVQSINYPTVNQGEERLRITPGPGHTVKMANHLTSAVKQIWETLGLRYTTDWQNVKDIKLETNGDNVHSLWNSYQLSLLGKCRKESLPAVSAAVATN